MARKRRSTHRASLDRLKQEIDQLPDKTLLDKISTDVDRGYQPDIAHTKRSVLETLLRAQDRFGNPLRVVSGYRDAARNARAGGAKRSQHKHGNAVDISTRGYSKKQKLDLIERLSQAGYSGIGVYANAVHADLGPKRVWGPNFSSTSVPAWARSALNTHLQGGFGALPPPAPVQKSAVLGNTVAASTPKPTQAGFWSALGFPSGAEAATVAPTRSPAALGFSDARRGRPPQSHVQAPPSIGPRISGVQSRYDAAIDAQRAAQAAPSLSSVRQALAEANRFGTDASSLARTLPRQDRAVVEAPLGRFEGQRRLATGLASRFAGMDGFSQLGEASRFGDRLGRLAGDMRTSGQATLHAMSDMAAPMASQGHGTGRAFGPAPKQDRLMRLAFSDARSPGYNDSYNAEVKALGPRHGLGISGDDWDVESPRVELSEPRYDQSRAGIVLGTAEAQAPRTVTPINTGVHQGMGLSVQDQGSLPEGPPTRGRYRPSAPAIPHRNFAQLSPLRVQQPALQVPHQQAPIAPPQPVRNFAEVSPVRVQRRAPIEQQQPQSVVDRVIGALFGGARDGQSTSSGYGERQGIDRGSGTSYGAPSRDSFGRVTDRK